MDMENEEEIEENELQLALEELYHKSITLAKKKKKLKTQMEAMTKENEELKVKQQGLKESLINSSSSKKSLTLNSRKRIKKC